jgi:hypothetical protein
VLPSLPFLFWYWEQEVWVDKTFLEVLEAMRQSLELSTEWASGQTNITREFIKATSTTSVRQATGYLDYLRRLQTLYGWRLFPHQSYEDCRETSLREIIWWLDTLIKEEKTKPEWSDEVSEEYIEFQKKRLVEEYGVDLDNLVPIREAGW